MAGRAFYRASAHAAAVHCRLWAALAVLQRRDSCLMFDARITRVVRVSREIDALICMIVTDKRRASRTFAPTIRHQMSIERRALFAAKVALADRRNL